MIKIDHVTLEAIIFIPWIPRIILEIRQANNKSFLTYLYRSLSQNKDQFDEFRSSLNILMSSINDKMQLASIITGGFNATSKIWYSQDITNNQRSIIGSPKSTFAYHQLINSPTRMTNTSSSCIDLSFNLNQSFIQNLVLKISLYMDCCHYCIVF